MYTVLAQTAARFYPTQAARIGDMSLQGSNIRNTACVCGSSPIAFSAPIKMAQIKMARMKSGH
ncbi:MAG TPA: hypothetical protein V6D10_17770 [Trichocoleus sp.]